MDLVQYRVLAMSGPTEGRPITHDEIAVESDAIPRQTAPTSRTARRNPELGCESDHVQREVRQLELTTGVGRGPTSLAAFDAALRDAGLANFNLIRLSSVIPDRTVVVTPLSGKAKPSGEWGDRLYLVLSDSRTAVPNEEAWAGIGWGQESETGKGLFVEYTGRNAAEIGRDIDDNLKALFAGRGMPLRVSSRAVAGVKCLDQPVAAVVAAVYAAEPWSPCGRVEVLHAR
jgi:arginine decarboxylase